MTGIRRENQTEIKNMHFSVQVPNKFNTSRIQPTFYNAVNHFFPSHSWDVSMWTCTCLVKRKWTTLLQLIRFKTWARGRTHLRNQLQTDNVESFLPCLPSSICLVGIITVTFDMTKLSPAMGHRYCAEKARAFMTDGFDDCFTNDGCSKDPSIYYLFICSIL